MNRSEVVILVIYTCYFSTDLHIEGDSHLGILTISNSSLILDGQAASIIFQTSSCQQLHHFFSG